MRAAADILNGRFKGGSSSGSAPAPARRAMPHQHKASAPQATGPSPRSVSANTLSAPPSRLYKYLPREFAESLVQRGSTRIGTLRDFRDEEKHGKGIGDATEGTKTIHARLDGTFDGGTRETAAINQLGTIFIGEGCKDITFEGSMSVSQHTQPDALVWCCSTERSAKALTSIDGADTCVEIFDVTGFFDALDRAVRAHFSSYNGLEKFGPFKVSYQSRTEEWNQRDLGLNPVFIKEDIPVFASQREVRAAWFNRSVPDATFKAEVLPASDCNQFCKIVDPADSELGQVTMT